MKHEFYWMLIASIATGALWALAFNVGQLAKNLH